jgi:hypothetical protein
LSDDEDRVRFSIHGLMTWFSDSSQEVESQVQGAVRDLVREVGIGIAARRSAALRPSLDFARVIFKIGPHELLNDIAKDCEHGLIALLEEASYSRSDQNFDVPAIRAASYRLAAAMAKAGFGGLGVKAWLEQAKNDPLPEVRNAPLQEPFAESTR